MVFGGDERAQSVVIGSLLVFTIIILSFSGYQAFVVPNQNAQVEADHFQDVEAQFAELRSNVINSIGANETRSTTIDLGTRYPSRSFALNPPPAAGKLETTEAGKVTITDANGAANICAPSGGATPTTRSLVYTPNYNEYQPPQAIGYENRILSREYRDGTLFDQRMVNSNTNTISLYLFTGSVSENGIKSYSLEVNGSRQYTETLTDPTITVPSEYAATIWDDDILEGQDVESITDDGDRVRIEFSGEWEVSCAVVGLDSDPEFAPPKTGAGNGGDDPNINPNAPGDVKLNGASRSGSTVTVEFENLASTDTIATEARINFYHAQSGSGPSDADISESGEDVSGNLVVTGPYKELDPQITFTGGDTTDIVLDFTGTVTPNDWFVLTMQYDNGEVGQYFISLKGTGEDGEEDNGGEGNGGEGNGGEGNGGEGRDKN